MLHPALSWRRAGLMHITGGAHPLVCPAALTTAADAALDALQALAPMAELPHPGAALLGERARLMGLSRAGTTSPNGTCRILPTQEGAIALSLSRPEDFAALAALCEDDSVTGWENLAPALRTRQTGEILVQGKLLGLPLSRATAPHTAPDVAPTFRPPLLEYDAPTSGQPAHKHARQNKELERDGPGEADPTKSHPARATRAPKILDLTALWAGPLATSLLALCGADVTKLESTTRPDGARRGHKGFYALLNHQKRSRTADFSTREGLAALHEQISAADIIFTACRPRALGQLGIDPAAEAARGAVFVTLTGHPDGSQAFGDDAAAAAGLNALMQAHWGEAFFAGDAIADPLTGLYAALYAWSAWLSGGHRHIAMSLSGTVANILARDTDVTPARTREWQALAEADTAPLFSLRLLPPC
jgi:hypothetical protein